MTHTCGAKVWLVIPRKSVLADRRLSHCNNCHANFQRVAVLDSIVVNSEIALTITRSALETRSQIARGDVTTDTPVESCTAHPAFHATDTPVALRTFRVEAPWHCFGAFLKKRPQTQVWHRVRVPPASPARFFVKDKLAFFPVPYTHLTLPTNREVCYSVGPVALNKKHRTSRGCYA